MEELEELKISRVLGNAYLFYLFRRIDFKKMWKEVKDSSCFFFFLKKWIISFLEIRLVIYFFKN